MALEGERHEVFFDRARLPAGEPFHERIRSAMADSDRVIFLVSPESVEAGAYTRTELDLVKKKWPHPRGRVLPVVVRPVATADIPAYLRGVTLLSPEGSVAAEVAGWVSSSPGPRMPRRGVAALAMVLLLAAAGAAWWAGPGTPGPSTESPAGSVDGLLRAIDGSSLDEALAYLMPAATAMASEEVVLAQLSQLGAALAGADNRTHVVSLEHPRVPPSNVPGTGHWVRVETGPGPGTVCMDFWLGRSREGAWLVGWMSWRPQRQPCTDAAEARVAAEVGREFLGHVHAADDAAADTLLAEALRALPEPQRAQFFINQRAFAAADTPDREVVLAVPTTSCGPVPGDCVMAEFRPPAGSFVEQVMLERTGGGPWRVMAFLAVPTP